MDLENKANCVWEAHKQRIVLNARVFTNRMSIFAAAAWRVATGSSRTRDGWGLGLMSGTGGGSVLVGQNVRMMLVVQLMSRLFFLSQ